MVDDTEPRYRLVDSNGNVVGSLYAQADGALALQEGTSGSDNEVTVETDGTFNAPAVSTLDLAVDNPALESDPDNPDNWMEQTNSNGSTTRTEISLSVEGDNTATGLMTLGMFSGLVMVIGRRQSNENTIFVDHILTAKFSTLSVTDNVTRESPGPRSYSVTNGPNGIRLDIAIDDAGGTYNTQAIAIGGLEP